MSTAIAGRLYRHFKGNLYRVLAIGLDAGEENKPKVIYQDLKEKKTWVRDFAEFESPHESGAERFTLLGSGGRPSWDEYFMNFAHAAAVRSTCDRKFVGAVIVRDRDIQATGYNGSAPGEKHCDEAGHDMQIVMGRESCVRTVHAEMNAIFQSAKHGKRLEGSTLYTNTFPCWFCAKAILSAKIARVVIDDDYHNDPRVTPAFSRAGVEITRFTYDR